MKLKITAAVVFALFAALLLAEERQTLAQAALRDDAATQLLRLTNALRAEDGKAPLALDESLCAAAQLKADEMAEKGYFSHISPVYGSPAKLLSHLGISCGQIGENMAKGYPTAEEAVAAWINGSGHLKNIRGEGFKRTGIGYNAEHGIWVQIFTD